MMSNRNTFVTKETTPVRLTVALPRVSASPMDTSGIRDTLVTVGALPAILASARRRVTSKEEDQGKSIR